MSSQITLVFVLVALGLLAYGTCLPPPLAPEKDLVDDVSSNVLETEWPEMVLQQGRTLISEVLKLRPQGSDKDVLLQGLNTLSRRGRQLMLQESRQATTLVTFANSLGDLFRPAITALVGSLSMNLATSATNAVTASLGGRSLDIIPPEIFASTPAGRLTPVEQPFSDFLESDQPQRKRPLKKRQRQQSFHEATNNLVDR